MRRAAWLLWAALACLACLVSATQHKSSALLSIRVIRTRNLQLLVINPELVLLLAFAPTSEWRSTL